MSICATFGGNRGSDAPHSPFRNPNSAFKKPPGDPKHDRHANAGVLIRKVPIVVLRTPRPVRKTPHPGA